MKRTAATAAPRTCGRVASTLYARRGVPRPRGLDPRTLSRPSGSPTIARIVSAMHLRHARLGMLPWFEFVKSEANPADRPSRGDVSGADALGVIEIDFVFPPCHSRWE